MAQDPTSIPATRAPSDADSVQVKANDHDQTWPASTHSNEFHPTTRFYLAWCSICVLVLMAALDATMLSVALAQISRVLGGSAIEAFWSGTAFLLTATVFQPVIGSLSGIFGRKPFLYVSLVFFLVGSIVAALAPTGGSGMPMLLVGRAIQGVGGGGIIVMSELLPTDLVPLRQRGNYLGIIGAMWALGSVGGPLVGGGLAGAGEQGWRWIFWINLPFIAIGGAMITVFLNLSLVPGSFRAKLQRIDYVGIVTFVAGTTGFLIPLTWGGVMYPWSHWRTVVPLVVSAATLVFFVVWEEKFAKEPLIPLRITKNRSAAVAYVGTFLHGMILWCLLYYAPLYFEAVKGYSPLISGLAIFPSSFTIAPASIFVGVVTTMTGRYRWSVWLGWFLATLGFGLQYLFDVETSTAAWACILVVGGVGTGLLFGGLAFSVQASTPEEDVASAVSLFVFLRTFGQAVGVAVGGVIFQNQLSKQIASRAIIAANADEWSGNASALVQMIHVMEAGPVKAALLDSYSDALKTVWAVCCAFAGVGLLLSLLTREFNLNRALESQQQFADRKRDSKDVERQQEVKA